MSKRTYVCIDCRTSKRAEAAYGMETDFRCAQCQGPLEELPHEWRIPKKGDTKEWEKLRKIVADWNREWLPERYERGVNALEYLDNKIAKLEAMKPTPKIKERLAMYRRHREQAEKGFGLKIEDENGTPNG